MKSVAGGTDALGEVTVRLSDRSGTVHWGRGSSMDIIEASAKAYVQALNKLVPRAAGAARAAKRNVKRKAG